VQAPALAQLLHLRRAATGSGASLMPVTGPELLSAIRASGARGVVVNAWASWCTPCREELPVQKSLALNLEARGLVFVLLSLDEPDSQPNALVLLQAMGLEQPSYVAEPPVSALKEALNPAWRGMIPATFLYDGAGRLRYFWGGPVYEHELLPKLEEFLAGTLQDGQAQFEISKGRTEP
jgi:thiol-disulfide isomerase/thioredoxin